MDSAKLAGYAEGVLKSSLGKLGSFLWSEALLVGSVRQDIEFIRDELVSMDAVLQDVSRSGDIMNQQTKAWMLQVVEVACDAELCTDEFLEKVGARRRRGFAATVCHYVRSLTVIIPRYRIAKAIQAVKGRVKEVSERHLRYKTHEGPLSNNTEIMMQLLEKYRDLLIEESNKDLVRYKHLVAEDSLVGFHSDEILDICRQVTTSDRIEMLVIHGPVGSGKTSLARMVYRRRNTYGFRITAAAWVTVSPQLLDVEKHVLVEILRQVTSIPPQQIENYDVDHLSHKLQEELKDQRYLVVLDSLSSVSDWLKIQAVLPRGRLRKVVVTTRNVDVAKACCDGVPEVACLRYGMRPLSPAQVDELIDKLLPTDRLSRAYEDNWPDVRDLTRRTCCRPLALKCLCGVFDRVNMLSSLIQVNNQLAEVRNTKRGEDDITIAVLDLCWRICLPSYLLPCVEDLSTLPVPGGYALSRKKLMRRWIANDFVKPGRGMSVEEVAASYFNELISRGIIEPESVHPSGIIRKCRVNSAFWGLRNQSDNQPYITLDQTDNINQATNIENPNQGSEQQTLNALRTSFGIYSTNPSVTLNFFQKQLLSGKPKLLTFLDLEGCKDLSRRELDKLCEFVQLRFLSLRKTAVKRLPEKIGKLQFLETLDIRQTQIKNVPGGVVSLNRLKHLLAGYVYKPERTTPPTFIPCSRAVEVPVGIDEMRSLQTLAHVNATRASEILQAIRELKQLKKLGLVIREEKLNSRPLCISIMMLSASLRSLSICDERQGASLDFLEHLCFPPQKLESLNLSGNLGRLPSWIIDLFCLTKITLSHTQIGGNDLKVLGRLISLRGLKLNQDSFRELSLVLGKDDFRVLRMLVVHCDSIQNIKFEVGTAPNLEVFHWVLHGNPTGDIDGIGNLPMLKDVSLIGAFDEGLAFNMQAILKQRRNNGKMVALNFIRKEIWDSNACEANIDAAYISGNILGATVPCCFKSSAPS